MDNLSRPDAPREGWKEEDYDAIVQHIRDMADDELGLQPADTDTDTLLGLLAKALFERRRDLRIVRDQYDRRVARLIEEKREQRRERASADARLGETDSLAYSDEPRVATPNACADPGPFNEGCQRPKGHEGDHTHWHPTSGGSGSWANRSTDTPGQAREKLSELAELLLPMAREWTGRLSLGQSDSDDDSLATLLAKVHCMGRRCGEEFPGPATADSSGQEWSCPPELLGVASPVFDTGAEADAWGLGYRAGYAARGQEKT